MSASIAGPSAESMGATDSAASLLDVETTNWNAVKILALQQGFQLSFLESIRQDVSAEPNRYPADHDFGVETPLHISAARLDNGRVIFRFRSRQPILAPSTNFGNTDTRPFTLASQHDGMPRSSSSGAIASQSRSDAAGDTLQPAPKTSMASNLFRKTGNLSLKNSKSIPVLRRKASAGFASFAFSGADAGSSSSAATASSSTPATDHLGDTRTLAPALPVASSSRFASFNKGVSMARTGSTPVNGPHANRYGADHISEGDVLGAVLGLGQAELWADLQAEAQLGSGSRASSEGSSRVSLEKLNIQQTPPQLRLPQLSSDSLFARSPRLHQLREAQSFESNASDTTTRGAEDTDIGLDRYPTDLHPFLRKESAHATSYDDRTLVFDVMQCYQRPLLMQPHLQREHLQARLRNRVSASPPSLTESHSTSTQAQALPTSAAPGDDPRFAVWAVRSGKKDGTFVISNRNGQTEREQGCETSSPANESPTSKRRNRLSPMTFGDRAAANTTASAAPSPTASAASDTKGKAMLLAASAARLVAELTAEIDLDLRSDVFYTYREFMTPSDLLELLILRFEWAISEPGSAEDEARRRIVRVRTYVVIKHWLQHHFDFDFLPNRALRQRLATWLNSIAKDERVTARPADLSIANSLRKIVRGLKETYSQSGVGGLLLHDSGRLTTSSTERPKTDSISTFGSSSHDSNPSTSARSSTRSNELGMTSSTSASSITEDVDLDFNEDGSSHDSPCIASPPTEHSSRASPGQARLDSIDVTRAAAKKAAAESVLVSHRHSVTPASVHHSRSPAPAASPTPFALPHTSNAWSRAVVQTVGRLSKFKRALGARGMGMALDGHAELDGDAEECSDLLFVKAGLDSLFQSFAAEQARRQSSAASRASRIPRQRPLSRTDEANEEEEEGLVSQASEDSTGQEETPSLAGASTNRSTPASSIDLTAASDQHASHGHQSTHGLGIGLAHQERNLSDFSVAPHANEALGLDPACLQPLDSLARGKTHGEDGLHHAASEQTLRSVSRLPVESYSEEPARTAARTSVRRGPSIRDSVLSNGAPRIVQIDDIDLSSDEDDFAVRKALRRLPGARDLRQANTIKDLEPQQLVSGRDSIDSMASSMFRHPSAARHFPMGSFSQGHARGVSVDSALFVPGQLGSTHAAVPAAPPVITTVQSEMLDPDEALQGYELVKGFRLDDIESDDEEPGDVEAALRRLEGIIDEDRQKAKAKRVERMWQRSMARNAKRDTNERGADDAGKHHSQASLRSHGERTWSTSLTGGSLADAEDEGSNAPVLPGDRSYDAPHRRQTKSSVEHKQIRPQTSFLDLQDGSSASESGDHEEHREAVVPQLALHPPSASAVPSADSTAATGPSLTPAHHLHHLGASDASKQAPHPSGPGLFLSPTAGTTLVPPAHRSFLLSYRSESVARQMCLIEAELLRSVSWDELASSRWRERRYGAEVTDWEAFYRDRVRDRLEAQRQGEMYHERAVEAIVARFNLTSNWVASEIVLTQNIDERAAVICKLIRIAWKCYLQSNFASLAQIIFGLSTPWVQRLRRTWNRVGYFEMRMWRDLNSFVGPRHNFRHLRNAMLQLVEGSAAESGLGVSSAGSMAGEAGRSGTSRGCIPFFGLFVSDLMQYDAMPTLLDPTSPTMAATTTTSSQDGKLQLYPADPNAFADLAPLPPGIQLQPLINVLKFRSIAEVIRHVSAFQNAAKEYSAMFEAEKGAYVRCLKLRCLPGELLARLSHLVEP